MKKDKKKVKVKDEKSLVRSKSAINSKKSTISPKKVSKVKDEVKSEAAKEKELRKQARLEAKAEQQKIEEEITWKWWEEANIEENDGIKWQTLQHNGPYFPPEYVPLPKGIHLIYDGQPIVLNPLAEEAAYFYATFIDHEYTTKEVFRNNFFTDFCSLLNEEELKIIKKLEKCDFRIIHNFLVQKKELRKQMTAAEKNAIKAANKEIEEKYGYCVIDGHRQKIGNYKLEPPGLFRGRGEHPKMGMLKKRILPEQITINCSK